MPCWDLKGRPVRVVACHSARIPSAAAPTPRAPRSTEYCSHCYRSGRFTEPNISLDEMMTKVEGKLREMHIPGFLARRFTKSIPQLRRWQRAPAGQAG
jgi:hypothetical protein